MNSKMMRAAALAGGLALALTACGDDDNGDATETETGDDAAASEDLDLVNEGTLTVCSDIPYAPFEFEDESTESGFSGFDIDLMQEIADSLELELSVLITGFDAIESGSALAANTCDVAASAMTINEQRAENLSFSDPYYDSLQSLLVSSDAGVSSLDEFSGRSLGVQADTTGADFAHENAPEDTEVIGYPTDAELLQAIQAGNIDGILQDLPVNLVHAEEEEGLELVEEFDTGEQYGFAVRFEGKETLLEAINTELANLRDEGTYQEIYDSYFTAD